MVRVAIIGAGLMGHGLALVFAQGGHEVWVTDPQADALDSLHVRVKATLASLGKTDDCVSRIHAASSLEDAVSRAELVVEAAPEKLELKQALFERIEAAASMSCILASNTSVIPITQVMAKVKYKARALGTHWWNPPYLVPLVEVIQTAETEPSIVTRMMKLLADLGKVPVHVKKDVPGFVGNRLQHALWREAISLIEHGVCDAETVDLVVKNSFGRRLAVLGPIENADLVGTDLTLDIHNQVLASLEDAHQPSPYLQKLVADGQLGFKTDRGFKIWDTSKKDKLRKKVTEHLKAISALLEEQNAI
ncbi:3-hydroxyacyl-CoA dehydrogenase family protein [Aestuariivirga litoralis]|uniref:3-hydroxyacyl-CoA dehydrogenase family protein n=1 Tax=Aestuariivirga litoralis TaxID=2650924 RepID=UPI0018C6A877|nr:3-hydroxyacyl-CoA dehydrogenase NAD-binding domain-containing protein [Aestuariivirga litoralis]MBG1233265.1 3-hydroxyacyl-CoA dehydrogenase family protein [Aestuariivirga litoralis]